MPSTRRSFLRAALPAAAVGLAGCSSDTGVRTDERERSGTVSDPAVHQTRNPAREPVVTDPDGDRVDRELIGDRARIDRLEFAPGVPDAAVDPARSFLEATDFSAQTLYVTHRLVQSCHRLRVRSVSWEPRRVEFEYCEELRPPDERCTADARETLALFFRLPAVVDTEVTGSGASGRRPCRNADTDYERIDANASAEGEEP